MIEAMVSSPPRGGRSELCQDAVGDRWGKPIFHSREIGDRVSPGALKRLPRGNSALCGYGGRKIPSITRQTPELPMGAFKCRTALT
jgi:hypothetical protein